MTSGACNTKFKFAGTYAAYAIAVASSSVIVSSAVYGVNTASESSRWLRQVGFVAICHVNTIAYII
jgi:hypothetical protein